MRVCTAPLFAASVLLAGTAAPADEPAPPPRVAVTLDQLNPADIPAEERFEGQPKELVAVLGSSRGRHAELVTCAAVSPDGKLIASGGSDKTIRLWDARTLRPLVVLQAQTETSTLTFSPDGKWLASCGPGVYDTAKDQVVRVWAVDGARSRLVATGRPHKDMVLDVLFVREGRELFSVSRDGEVRSWDLTADPPAERTRLAGTGRYYSLVIGGFRFVRDGQELLIANRDGRVRLMDLTTDPPAERGRFRIDPGGPAPVGWSVYTAEFTPDGRTLLVQLGWGIERTDLVDHWRVEVWDVATGKRRLSPPWEWKRGLSGNEFGFGLLPDGKTFSFGLVARGEGREVPVCYFPKDGTRPSVDQIDKPQRVVLWDLTGREPRQVGTVSLDQVYRVIAAKGGRSVSFTPPAVSYQTITYHLWTTRDGQAMPAGKLSLPHYGRVDGQCLSADGTVLVARTGNRVRVWDLTADGPVERATDAGPGLTATAVAFGPGGRSVVAAGYDLVPWYHSSLARWDLAAGPPRAHLLTPLQVARNNLVFSRDGRRYTSPWSGPVYDAATGRPVYEEPPAVGDFGGNLLGSLAEQFRPVGKRTLGSLGPGEPRRALNNDGTVLARTADTALIRESGYRVYRVNVWDVRGPDRELIARLEAAGGSLTAIALSPDGRRAAISTSAAPQRPAAGGEVVVWDVGRAEPTVVARLPSGKAGATSLAFTADGKGLAAVLPGDGLVQVWDLAPKPRERWRAAMKDSLSVIQFTPGGRLVGLGSGGLYLWGVDGKPALSWPELAGVRGFALAPDGRHVATANANGTVYILRLPSG